MNGSPKDSTLESQKTKYFEVARHLLQAKLCDSDSLEEQLHRVLESVDSFTGPIKHLIHQSEQGKALALEDYKPPEEETEEGEGEEASFASRREEESREKGEKGIDVNLEVEFASVVPPKYNNNMGTPRSDEGSPLSMEQLLQEQGYVTPENQKVDSSDYSPANSEASSVRSTGSTDRSSPRIPEDIETAMRKKEMERFMKRVALKHKAMSPETRERIEKNRRNSVLGTGVTPRKEVGKSTKDFFNNSSPGGGKFKTPGSGSGAAFASSKRPDLFKVDVADGGHNRHGRRGSIMDVLDPGGKSKKGGNRGKIRRKSCIDMSKEVTERNEKKEAGKDKGWNLDGKTPPANRRASISVFKPLS